MTRAPRTIVKPHIPEDTCPYIDMVQELIGKIAEENNHIWRSQQETLAKSLLEHIRESNHELRTASKFWYDQYQKVSKN